MEEGNNNGRVCCVNLSSLAETGEISAQKFDSCSKLSVFNWLQGTPGAGKHTDLVEVKFKNTRKGYFRNVNHLKLKKGDIVAVEASPGHDIGIIGLTGDLVQFQLRKLNMDPAADEYRIVYRKAKPADIEKWKEAIGLENSTMLKARKIAADLKLDMKIGDVEYQGDRTKAIFYYIADERVDFRELIKILAEEFKVRIEMRQIGARQEAGRIGGIGPCGRELCCCTWISNFVSVTTTSARYQDLTLNPQKLAGQCGKLKCCLNYELDGYLDAQKDFPDTSVQLMTDEGTAYHQKSDVFNRLMWYSFEKESSINMIAVPVERVREIIEMNRKNIKVKKLVETATDANRVMEYNNVIEEENPDRFSRNESKRRKKKRRRRGDRHPNNPSQP
jgi:cell fate regulator YaaT (PSP1 superfamily)